MVFVEVCVGVGVREGVTVGVRLAVQERVGVRVDVEVGGTAGCRVEVGAGVWVASAGPGSCVAVLVDTRIKGG